MGLQPAPAFAAAGMSARAPFRPSGASGLLDSFVKGGDTTAVGRDGPGPLRASLFAAAPTEEFCQAPTAAGVSADAAIAAAAAAASAKAVSAYSVYMAFYTMRTLQKVILDDEELVKVISFRSWIKEVSPMERQAMKGTVAGLESREEELEALREALGQKGPLTKRIRELCRTLFGLRGAEGPKPSAISSASTLGLSGKIKTLWARKRELEADVARARIAKEWFERTAWSHYGYIRFTDAGWKILEILDRHREDPRMNDMNIDDYLALLAKESKR